MIDSYLTTRNFNSICLISSAGCNLNCKYCEISKSKDHQYANELQNKIKTAFEDGSFLSNIVTSLKILHQNFYDITSFTFWGQEPTLTFDSFRTNLKDWFEVFPNVNNIFFSTNGGTNPTIIYNLIKDIDAIIDHEIEIAIQYSYDGEWSCREERLINPELVKNNQKKLVSLLNMTLLNHVQIRFCWHGVVSFNLMYHLLETNGIEDYLKELDNTVFESAKTVSNPNCKTYPITLGLEQPYQASTDDGLVLRDFLEKGLRIELYYKFHFANPMRMFLVTLMGRANFEDKVFDDDKWTQILIDIFNSTELNTVSIKGNACGTYKTELKFMYDGTLIGCQNFLFSTSKEHLIDSSPMFKTVKENAIDHHLFINLTDPNLTIEDADKVFNRFQILHQASFVTEYQSLLNTIILLATAGQASSEYLTNKEKLFIHAFMIIRFNSCFFNHMVTTGTTFLEPINLCRALCNGALDIAEKEYYIMRKEKKE